MSSQGLTWAVLLGQWIEFARTALALPDTGDGLRMRESVADIITLQAVWFALQHLDELDAKERSLGLDRAQLLIETHGGALRQRWADDQMPKLLAELIVDAEKALADAEGGES